MSDSEQVKTKDSGNHMSFPKDVEAKVFPEELKRRRWSIKEIVRIVTNDLGRNGRLVQAISKLIKKMIIDDLEQNGDISKNIVTRIETNKEVKK